MASERHDHWNNVYASKGEAEVSWYQEMPAVSLELLDLAGADPRSAVIDIGGGLSRLADELLARGYRDVSVLDISGTALAAARARLGEAGDAISWIEADIVSWSPDRQYDVWHDRAAFHFLIQPADQAAYAERLRSALRPGGHAIIGTFAPDGPEKCSGLPVARHDAQSLSAILGPAFSLVHTRRHAHVTPAGATQNFQFSVFRFDG